MRDICEMRDLLAWLHNIMVHNIMEIEIQNELEKDAVPPSN